MPAFDLYVHFMGLKGIFAFKLLPTLQHLFISHITYSDSILVRLANTPSGRNVILLFLKYLLKGINKISKLYVKDFFTITTLTFRIKDGSMFLENQVGIDDGCVFLENELNGTSLVLHIGFMRWNLF